MNDPTAQFEMLAEAIAPRLARNLPVRRNLPGEGRVRIDRQLPFLCVYRQPAGRADAGAKELVTTEAAYLFAAAEASHHAGLSLLCRQIVQSLIEHFGAFLCLEIWTPAEPEGSHLSRGGPMFRIVTAEADSLPTTIDALRQALGEVRVDRRPATVAVHQTDRVAPPGLPPLFDNGDCPAGCCNVGLEIQPVFRSPRGEVYPLVLQSLRRQLGPAIRRAVHAFSDARPNNSASHYHSLGPTRLVKAARLVDQQLCEVSETFDLVLQATPINSEAAWQEFSQSGHAWLPPLVYRPLLCHPNLLKRQLFQIPIERIEDATLAQLFWEKQDELDRQLTALRDIDTPDFLHSSLQLYPSPDAALKKQAVAILEACLDHAPHEKTPRRAAAPVPAPEIADQARREIDYYHQRLPGFATAVELVDDIASGMLVAQGRLFISEQLHLPRRRVVPLLHHEVGTHLLTYFNGRAQPFQQLYAGLAGYEPLQEGLAVLAEHLTGGLTPARLRALAARVVAVAARLDGAAFADTFQLLHQQYRLSPRAAFITALRVFRAGGFSKDAIYLAGLRDLLAYLSGGHDIEPLYVGKIALSHVPCIQELRRRGIIHPPALLPRFWTQSPTARRRLEQCRGLTLVQLLQCRKPPAARAAAGKRA